jgi:hypothetical protein
MSDSLKPPDGYKITILTKSTDLTDGYSSHPYFRARICAHARARENLCEEYPSASSVPGAYLSTRLAGTRPQRPQANIDLAEPVRNVRNMKMIPVMSDWYFDPLYEEQTKDELASMFCDAVNEWVETAYANLLEHIRKHPEQVTATTMEASMAMVEGSLLFQVLRLLRIDKGNSEPTQCLVFIGSESYIKQVIDEIKDHYMNEAKLHKGGSSFLVEQEFGRK